MDSLNIPNNRYEITSMNYIRSTQSAGSIQSNYSSRSYYLHHDPHLEDKQNYLKSCSDGNIPNVKLHIGEYHWYEDQDDNNCLFLAVKNNQPSLVETLLKERPKMNMGINKKGENAYLLAAQLPTDTVLKLLVKSASSEYYMKATDNEGNSLLQVAIIHSRGNVLKYLLSSEVIGKLDLYNRNKHGQNILHLLLNRSNHYGGGLGLTMNIEKTSRRKDTDTPSKTEPSASSKTEPSASSKTEPSASSTTEPSDSSTTEPSDSSTTEPSDSSTTEPSDSSTTEPSVLQGKYTSAESFIHIASKIAMDPTNKQLLKDVDEEGNSIFIMACKRGATKIIKYLCQNQKNLGLNLNLQDKKGCTGLHYLVGLPKNLKWILEHGREASIDPSVTDNDGYNVLGHAMVKGQLKMFSYMIKNAGYYNIPVSQTNKLGQNLVLSSIINSNIPEKFLKELYDTKDYTGINFESHGNKHETPLQLTIIYDRPKALTFLIEHLDEKSLQLQRQSKKTSVIKGRILEPPVVMLSNADQESVLKTLVNKYGIAILQVANQHGNSPLMKAIKRKTH